MSNPSKYPCGCGLSRTFPICDGTQKIAKTNAPGKLYQCGAPGAASVPNERSATFLDAEVSVSMRLAIDA